MRRLLGSLGFVLVLFTLALPWMSFSVGCSGNIAPQSGVRLLAPGAAQISVHNENEDTEGRVHIPGQAMVWLTLGLAAAGAALGFTRWRRRHLAQALIAAVALAAVALYSAILINGGAGVTFSGTGKAPETQVRAGEFSAVFLLVMALLVNLTLPLVFHEGFGSTLAASRGRSSARIAVYSTALIAGSGIGLWGVAVIVGAAT